MFNISDIKGTDDYLIFFKIIEKDYLQKLVKDGQVYFSLLSTIREMEQNEGKSSIGDKNECLLTKEIYEYIGYEGEYHQIHGPKSGYNAKINCNQCAFCSYALGLKEFMTEDNHNYYHKMPYSTIENICKDKNGIDNCVMVIFYRDIVDRVLDSLYGRYSYNSGPVIYDDFHYKPQHDINSEKYALECCFHKETKYEYQKEFRIAAINHTNHPIDNIYINVTENDFTIMELKENCDFCCSVKIDAERIEDYNGKEQQKVQFSFSLDFEAIKNRIDYKNIQLIS